MDTLEIPLLLTGSWEHLFIMTFGLDLPFFERSLMPQLPVQCRNKIILCDGQRYIDECAIYARNTGLLRHLNRTYVADGVFPPTAHAKVILLANKESGRLLVGSGNLNLDGYAGRGELFTKYDFSHNTSDTLNAFLAVRDVMEWLIGHDTSPSHVSGQAIRQLRHLIDDVPWLQSSFTDQSQPVRSNISRSFLDQLIAEIGGRPVEELWILSPFYDKGAQALRQLLQELQPRDVKLLVQERFTSVDRDILQHLYTDYTGQLHIHPFLTNAPDKNNTYVHAKLYLVKLADEALCLQGSPNLSRAAMLHTAGSGNLEIANMLRGKRDEFDYVLDRLTMLESVTDVGALELEYRSDERVNVETTFYLKSGEFYNNQLSLCVAGTLPALETIALLIDGLKVPFTYIRRTDEGLKFGLPPDLTSLSDRPCPVALQWGNGQICNPVFPVNRRALQEHMQQQDVGKHLSAIGDLESYDSNLEELLRELEATLIIDSGDVWHTSRGRSGNIFSDTGIDENAITMRDVYIDTTALQKYSGIRKYPQWGTSYKDNIEDSPLIIILRQIYKRLSRLHSHQVNLTVAFENFAELMREADDLTEGQSEEEAEEDENAATKRRASSEERLRYQWKRFINRYLDGAGDKQFRDAVGCEVMAQNYHIFSYILWQLFSKEWFEPEVVFVSKAAARLIYLFWGSKESSGYFSQLGEDEWQAARSFMAENYTYEVIFASCFQCANSISENKWTDEKLAFQLRDSLRNLLVKPPCEVSKALMLSVWELAGDLPILPSPSPLEITQQLTYLASFNTEQGLFNYLEKQYGYRASDCSIKPVNIHGRANVDCLVIANEGALSSLEEVIDILKQWMLFHQSDYYRIRCESNERGLKLVQYDTKHDNMRHLHDLITREEQPLPRVEPLDQDWGEGLRVWRDIAVQAQQEVQFSVKRIDA